jgi:tetratricopeptide (TPR) repeat protein
MTSPHAHRRALAAALFLAVALVPLAAAAQPTETQKREAKDLNDKATRLYEVGRYEEAIAEYQKVYLIVDDPVLLYNIAQSYRLWGKPEDAVRFYRNYLRRAPNAPNRADVEKKIADQEHLAEEKRRAPTTAPPPVTTAPPVEATPPPVTTAPPGTTAPPLATTPPPVVEGPPAATVVQPEAPPPESHHGRKVAGITCLIVGGGLVAIAAVEGSLASKKAKDLERMSQDPSKPVFDPGIQTSGQNANKVAVGAGVAGALAGAIGGILLLTSGSTNQPVAVYPMVGPQLAGGGARVSF